MDYRFTNISLENRLGQIIGLGVTYVYTEARDYVFVTAPAQQASSLVGKSAEHFAFQLLRRFELNTRRFVMIELRGTGDNQTLWRWRFEWVGESPLSARCEEVNSPGQRQQLLNLLEPDVQKKVVAR